MSETGHLALTTDRRSFLKVAAATSTVVAGASVSRAAKHVAVGGALKVTAIRQESHGVLLTLATGAMRVMVYSDRVIRVLFSPTGDNPQHESLAVIHGPVKTTWQLRKTATHVVVSAKYISARIDRATGVVEFLDAHGKVFLAESNGGRSMLPVKFKDVATYRVRQKFVLQPNEAIFGLGEHPRGVANNRGEIVHLAQRNPTHIGIPFMMSSMGYGLFWDNPAMTVVKVGAGKEPNVLNWHSHVGSVIDYYVMYGPDLDVAMAQWRNLSGAAPMMGRWVWGYWQSKNRYENQLQVLGVASEYRSLKIPIDGIVQDWFYWYPHPWGSNILDPLRYPRPTEMINQLHRENLHFMISVWAKFAPGSSNYNLLKKAGALYPMTGGSSKMWNPATAYYDAFNPLARKLYWSLLNKDLFSKGVDAWWLDASEPELGGKWGEFADVKTYAGWGAFVYNAYPLMHTGAVYNGQRSTTDVKRVMILTRSAWAGQQRHSAITWSGDVAGNLPTLALQIPAGINFCLSGIPYWNTDIGGYLSGNPQDPVYRECFIRWFQFGAFCPMFRVHGCNYPKEMWRFGPPAMAILEKFDRLRYHLLPYIYSVAWMVTNQGYTMLRGLVMDFRTDSKVYDIPDQFMFGPAVLVNPVTKAGAVSRQVYLPESTQWFDFWTGRKLKGGQHVEAPAALDSLPLYIRAGSIIPFGPSVQNAQEPADPIELRVYDGANGEFTLYEDEGDSYDYEKGTYATITFTWDDKAGKLTIGQRHGTFPDMLNHRTFRIVFVGPDHGVGIEPAQPDQIVHYDGHAVVLHRAGA